MIQRTIRTGLLAGLLISLAGIYPLMSMAAPMLVLGWQPLITNALLRSVLLLLSAAVGIPIFIFGGAWAARRAQAYGTWTGFRAGALAGATAGSGVYITVISPLTALIAYGQLTPHLPQLTTARPLPPAAMLRYVYTFDNVGLSMELTLLIFVFVWGLAGMLGNSALEAPPVKPRPTMFSLVASGKNLKSWFAGDETAVRTGLVVGVVVGMLALITTFGWFYAGIAQDLPEFDKVIQESRTGMVTGPISQALGVLSPLLIGALLIYGIIIVALIKNPPDRFNARFQAVFLATLIIAMFLSAVGLRIIYFNLGLAPFLLSQLIRQDPVGTGEFMLQFAPLLTTLSVPVTAVVLTVVLAWLTVFLAIINGVIFGFFQAVLSTIVVTFIWRRPVDRAAKLQRRIRHAPEYVLPLLHRLCIQRAEAYDILVHLAMHTARRQPQISRLAAAFHTMGTSAAAKDRIDTVEAVVAILRANPDWRWARDFATVYDTLRDVLLARKLEDILALQPPPHQGTASLPPNMTQSMQYIGRIITELQKTNKVDDLPTRLIFLENSLAIIHEAQRFVHGTMSNVEETAVSLPQYSVLNAALEHWQGIAMIAIKRLKGRADLVSTLQSQSCAHCVPLPLVWQIQNKGLNVAQEVRLRILPGQDYLVEDGEVEIEILPPGEDRQVTLSVIPHEQTQRLRVAWEILYDDAVVDDRSLTFADVVTFAQEERPFQRIFPIPYVTGTPLKTDDVFVGRNDIFAFIRENLLGTHQNNVIILHGQRRTGKTSVLYRLGQVMVETHVGVLIDMQGKPARNEVDFLYSIADDIVFALEDAGIDVELPHRAEFEESPEFYFRARFLRSLYPHLNGKHLLLMFDEFEELQSRVENGRLQPEIFQFLRNLMQHEDPLDFVFSGTHRLEDLGAGYWSILFNIAAYKPVTFLAPAEVKRLMIEPVADYDIEYDPLAADRIIQMTAGHPYFTQLILHEMMVYHNESERNYLTLADVDHGVERILERGEAHFKHIWAESADEERLVLQAMAELLHSAEVVDAQDMRTFLHERGYHSEDNWQMALASLNGRDILTRRDVRSRRYRYKVDIIRLWINHTRPAL
ncbi:MAG: ATP-binding protein [Anaerolineales bacterium]|nr:ATP-binding protein [Anaerolineales bacterium]